MSYQRECDSNYENHTLNNPPQSPREKNQYYKPQYNQEIPNRPSNHLFPVNVRNNCTDSVNNHNHPHSPNQPIQCREPGNGEQPAIHGCTLYENDCNVPENLCKQCPDVCVNDYWYELNNRLKCNSYMFDRWKTIYQMTTDQVGRQLIEKRSDCRRKPFYPRRCKLCDITDDMYITEQLCKKFIQPPKPNLTCYGDYQLDMDNDAPKHPPGMIMTSPQHCSRHHSTNCFKKIPDPRFTEINELMQYVRHPENLEENKDYRKY